MPQIQCDICNISFNTIREPVRHELSIELRQQLDYILQQEQQEQQELQEQEQQQQEQQQKEQHQEQQEQLQ